MAALQQSETRGQHNVTTELSVNGNDTRRHSGDISDGDCLSETAGTDGTDDAMLSCSVW